MGKTAASSRAAPRTQRHCPGARGRQNPAVSAPVHLMSPPDPHRGCQSQSPAGVSSTPPHRPRQAGAAPRLRVTSVRATRPRAGLPPNCHPAQPPRQGDRPLLRAGDPRVRRASAHTAATATGTGSAARRRLPGSGRLRQWRYSWEKSYGEKMGFGTPGLTGRAAFDGFSLVRGFCCCLGFLHFHDNLPDSQEAHTLSKR